MILKPSIKNIIFDLGRVLLNLDYSLTTAAFQNISTAFVPFDPVYSDIRDKGLFEDFEIGVLSPEQFRDGLRTLLKSDAGDEALDKAWNAMLLDFPEKRLRLLERLKKEYRIFLLSNTNEIHLLAVSDIIFRSFGRRDLSHVFEKEYFSNRIGMRKPDKKIFEFVLSDNKLDPAETFFIDDSPQHITGASTLGIETYLLKIGEDIADRFALGN